LFHTDGSTDMIKVIVTLHDFANTLKNEQGKAVKRSQNMTQQNWKTRRISVAS